MQENVSVCTGPYVCCLSKIILKNWQKLCFVVKNSSSSCLYSQLLDIYGQSTFTHCKNFWVIYGLDTRQQMSIVRRKRSKDNEPTDHSTDSLLFFKIHLNHKSARLIAVIVNLPLAWPIRLQCFRQHISEFMSNENRFKSQCIVLPSRDRAKPVL